MNTYKTEHKHGPRKLTHQEVLANKPEVDLVKSFKRTPFCLVVDNVRSLYNIGSFFRTGDAILIEKIFLCGITGTPPDKQISKTALGAVEVVDWEYFKNTEDCLKKLKSEGYKIYALELTDKSIKYNDAKYSFPMALILGNEVDGISDAAMNLIDEAIDIPMLGRANSLNVATAFAVVAYEIFDQFNLK